MPTRSRSALSLDIPVVLGALVTLVACSDPESTESVDGAGGANGGSTASGGVTASGGTSGGTTGGTSGGTTGGTSGGTTGGTSSGGGATTGGSAGTSEGGSAPGGSSSTGGAGGAGGPSGGDGGAPMGGTGGDAGAGAGGVQGGAAGSGGGSGGALGGAGASGAAGKGGAGAGGGAGKGGAGAGGGGSTCPLDLVGFATREGGTTGGGNAAATTVTTQAALRTCATATEARVCRVQGTITFSPFEEIRIASNKTILGAGATGTIVMGGFFLAAGVHNVTIRNLTIRDSFIEGQYDEGGDEGGDRDGVQMDTANHVWIDHVHFSHLGDGMIDSRMDTSFLTVSWNVLENHNKAFGIGWTENVTAQMTIHHNWIHDTVQRNPSTDNVLRAHLFNNLLENVESYGNYARGGTNMVLQNSVFVNVNDPYYYDTGSLVAIGNVVRNSPGQREASGTTFSFFDPGTLYGYSLDPADQVEAIVKRCTGPRAELGN